jgi:ribosome-binding protein aMBF1 (putative translation factor)
MGVRRIRVCKDCGRKFTPRNQKAMTDEEFRERSQTQHDTEE